MVVGVSEVPKTKRAVLSRLAIVLTALAYILLLDYAYVHQVYPNFRYMGFGWQQLPLSARAGLWSIALIPSFFMPVTMRPSVVAHWTLYLFVVVPSLIVPAYSTAIGTRGTAEIGGVLVCAHVMLGLVYRVPLSARHRPASGSRDEVSPSVLVLVLLVAVLYLAVVGTFGFRFDMPDLEQVYDTRMDYRESMRQQGRLVAYAVTWLANVVNPLLMAIALLRRKPALFILGFAGQLLLFSVTGYKTIILTVFSAPALVFAARRAGKNLGLYVGVTACVVVILSGLELKYLDSSYLNHMVVRRQMATPGLLTGHYFDFFSQNPKALLSHSILRGFVADRYSVGPPDLIGRLYFGPHNHSNANVWADAYANLGYAGVFGFTVLLGAVFWAFDNLSRHIPRELSTVLMAMPAITLSNSALLTALLSHGIGLAVVIALFWPRTGAPDD